MANTTNFNWETPDDTDLVKDGAAAIRTLGSAIDTSLVDLKGGTTDQVLAKNSNTDMDFKWVTSAGDIEGVTAGTGISGGGTSGTVTITNSMATAIDAKGDLIGGTGADTFARLAVGANGTVLTADSAETTGLKWSSPAAGGYTLLSTTSASGSSFTISTISTDYKHLFVQGKNFVGDTNQSKISFRFNSDTGSNYNFVGQRSMGSTYSTIIGNNATSLSSVIDLNNESTAQEMSQFSMWVYRYTDTDNVAGVINSKGADFSGGSSQRTAINTFFNYDCSAAVTSITVICGGGSFNGGTVYVYGVK